MNKAKPQKTHSQGPRASSLHEAQLMINGREARIVAQTQAAIALQAERDAQRAANAELRDLLQRALDVWTPALSDATPAEMYVVKESRAALAKAKP